MSKKNFKSSFDDVLLGNNNQLSTNITKSTSTPTFHETKATFVIKEDHLDKLRAVAFMERKMIKDILGDALSSFFENYAKENGKIILPKK